MRIIKWSAFAWGCLCVVVMANFLMPWIAEIDNPLYKNNELIEGFCISLLYGSPAWFALPVFAFLGRRKLSPLNTAVLLSPVILALALVLTWRILVK